MDLSQRISDVYSVGGTVLCVLLGLFITFIVKSFLKSRAERDSLSGVPGPPSHWLYGNLHQIPFGRGFEQVMQWTEEYGPLYVIRIGPFIHEVLLTGPEQAKALLSTAEPKDPYVYRMIIPWIGDGLLVSKGRKWARNRRLLTPAFHFDILKPYQKQFSESVLTMVMKWKRLTEENPQQSVEMFEHVSLMTLDTLMKCIFGLSGDFQSSGGEHSKTGHPYIKAVYDLAHLLWVRFHFVPYHNDLLYYFSYSGYKFRQTYNVAHKFTKSVIHKKKCERNSSDRVKPEKKILDFIDMLLECRDDEGKGLEDKEIQDEVDTFMFEGHDTTASAISWCLFNLAANPDCQEKCRSEVNEVVGEDSNEVAWEDLSKLTYLTMCVKESMRTHPPVPAVGRMLTKPLAFSSGQTLPPGTWCVVPIHAVNTNPDVWPEPEKYDPERFNPETATARHSHAFIPFSAGPRNCIGQHFAMNEVKTAVALVLKHFRLRLDVEKPADKIVKIVLRASSGVWLYLDSV